ncbi:MAG: Na(+)-translocating NADH-quinone reductase subunit A [Mangrovibacterium sp.]
MSKHFKFKRGLDIRLKGAAETVARNAAAPQTVALKPTDFDGLTPKLSVKTEARVKAGDALFFDKYHPEILFTSPVSGTVKSVNRGERRRILEVIVEPDGKADFRSFPTADPKTLSPEDIRDLLLKSGLWPFIKRRPYGILANPEEKPKHIFISGFNSSPLAPDFNFLFRDEQEALQTGIDILGQLTEGSVFLGLSPKQTTSVFTSLKNAEINIFEGPHPAGNVGVHIHRLSPLYKGDVVWTLSPQALVYIGRLFLKGRLDLSTTIALTGSEVKTPCYYHTVHGANLSGLLAQTTKKETRERYISGNVLTGTRVEADGFLGFFDQQLTVIPEGDDYELLGWALPGADKFSAGKTFLSALFPKKDYVFSANLHGGERAFVMSGQFEKLLPMDILPVFLLKAILAGDIDRMEQLGIYEVIGEDLALCEFADTSKIKIQDILQKGIRTMIKEVG